MYRRSIVYSISIILLFGKSQEAKAMDQPRLAQFGQVLSAAGIVSADTVTTSLGLVKKIADLHDQYTIDVPALYQQLLHACRDGNLEVATEALNKFSSFAVVWSSRGNKDLSLSKLSDSNRDMYGCTPLHYAAKWAADDLRWAHFYLVLQKAGFDDQQKNRFDITPRFLLGATSKIFVTLRDEQLYKVAQDEKDKVLNYLNADFVRWCRERDFDQVVDYLQYRMHQFDINAATIDTSLLPLDPNCLDIQEQVVIKDGITYRSICAAGSTALHYVAAHSNQDARWGVIYAQLKQRQFDENKKNNDGKTPLELAQGDNKEITNQISWLLLEQSCQVRSMPGITMLGVAAVWLVCYFKDEIGNGLVKVGKIAKMLMKKKKQEWRNDDEC